ncbi:MAG TPA: hypothetical protein PKE69_12625 [Pyrinomonadaceae bacterium]|nr:hypothetical protein [Pyrinomonadaceae bacterium]
MSLKQKLDRRSNQLRSASFNSFGQFIQDFWIFFDNEPILSEIGKNLQAKFPYISTWVRVFFEARQEIKSDSEEKTVAVAYEILRKVASYASTNELRPALMASIYPTEFSINDYRNQPEIDKNYLDTFKERYLETFCLYIEEQLEENEMATKTESDLKDQSNSTVIQNYGQIGSVQTGNHNLANINQNIGQNFSEILELLANLKREFQSLPDGDREEAIDIVDDFEKEIVKNTPNKSKIRGFLSATKEFAVKTGTELAASTLAKLLESQMGIKG